MLVDHIGPRHSRARAGSVAATPGDGGNAPCATGTLTIQAVPGAHRLIEIPTIILLLIAATGAVVLGVWTRVSYTLVLLALGLVIGLTGWLEGVTPSADIILLLFLPPLVFEAAFHIDVNVLRRVRAGVILLALPGVLVATVVGGTVVALGFGMSWTVALLFGALIAATDPVSVVATFRDLGVATRLRVLVEGESLVNDGTALVLVASLATAAMGDVSIPDAGLNLVLSIAGGTAVGFVFGCVAHRLIATIDDHLAEMAVSVAVAYGAFLLADELGTSGVLATIAAALVLRWLGRSRGTAFSARSHEVMRDLWEFLAFVANAGLFLLIGLEIRFADLGDHVTAIIWGIIAALIGRAVVAYGGGALLGRVGVRVNRSERHVLFWGGLRGAVALAGVLSLPPDIPHRDDLLAMTYGVVLFTLLGQGLTIGPLVRRLGLARETGRPAVDKVSP